MLCPQVLKHLYRQLVRKGLRMICVITKVDLVDEDVAEDVATVQTSFLTHLMRQCVSQNTGLPMNQVCLETIAICLDDTSSIGDVIYSEIDIRRGFSIAHTLSIVSKCSACSTSPTGGGIKISADACWEPRTSSECEHDISTDDI
jgi:hypothetical protein